MAVFAIGDLHLDSTGDKPMDIFGCNWENHENKIFESWKSEVTDDDLILLPGDISWALKLDGAYDDLFRIDKLPGYKVISKGNHDYWWETKKKMESLDLKTIHFLHNDFYLYKDIAICGTRGWAAKDSEEFNEHDEKVYNREINRLDLSLASIKGDIKKIIVMIHYPPFYARSQMPNEFVDVMKKYDADICVYGHLHAEGHKYAVEGDIDSITFHCVASDYVKFRPKKIL